MGERTRKGIRGGVRLAALLLTLAWAVAGLLAPVRAETPPPQATPTPVQGGLYLVRPGDTLASIAFRFGTTVDELVRVNGIPDPDRLQPGTLLLIPGLEGVSGVLTTTTVPWGADLTALSRRYGLSETTLRRLNRVLTPAQLYAGRSLIVPEGALQSPPPARAQVAPGESLAETAARYGVNPWSLALRNDLPGTWAVVPNEVLAQPRPASTTAATDETEPLAFPPEVSALTLEPTVWQQGQTVVVRLQAPALGDGATLEGVWQERPFPLFREPESGAWVALLGVPALLDPGLYPLTLRVALPDGRETTWAQPVRVRSAGYPWERLVVPLAFLDPEVNRAESAQVAALVSRVTPERYWQGPFQPPSPYADCFTSRFGTRRDYNDGTYYGYHSGVDFCGGTGTPIYAPADGVVVFAGPLEVRGNATIIDHGWGVYTGYWHQSEILVQEGQRVRAGEVIGYVGGTGRVTGAHLHWELWVNGVPVDPIPWLTRAYP